MSSQRPLKSIGDQELALLRFVSDAGHITVGQAAERFGQPRALARSTVLTMMERLRKKGHLARKLHDGLYHYAPRTAPGAAVREAVRNFVDRTLDGSIAPFVAYLGEREEVSDEDFAELKAQLARLQGQRRLPAEAQRAKVGRKG
jgi:predicted transcriptional regulator